MFPAVTSPYRLDSAKPSVAAGSPVVDTADPADIVVDHILVVDIVDREHIVCSEHTVLEHIVKDRIAMAVVVVERTVDIAQVVHNLRTRPVS